MIEQKNNFFKELVYFSFWWGWTHKKENPLTELKGTYSGINTPDKRVFLKTGFFDDVLRTFRLRGINLTSTKDLFEFLTACSEIRRDGIYNLVLHNHGYERSYEESMHFHSREGHVCIPKGALGNEESLDILVRSSPLLGLWSSSLANFYDIFWGSDYSPIGKR